MVTWPSAMRTTLLSLRTHRTVVPCIRALPGLFRIRPLYRPGSPRAKMGDLPGATLAERRESEAAPQETLPRILLCRELITAGFRGRRELCNCRWVAPF